MKKLILFTSLLSICVITQGQLLKKIGDKVKQKTENKVDVKVNKKVDKTIGEGTDDSKGNDQAASDMVLHYRHVNQGERWQHMPLNKAGGAKWTIPAAYSDSDFHIQFYVTATDGETVRMYPGLPITLDGAPYILIEQA